MKNAIVSVINDLSTDQRVDKTCLALTKAGYNTLLIGRTKKDSLPISERKYKTHRMHLIFEKGPLFYAEYNIRLYFFLLFKNIDLLFSNDLDTLLPNYIISKTKRVPLIFDSHEYFTETPELIHRPVVQKVWKKIESFILPKLKLIITVNESIANLFREEYNIDVVVIRNIPPEREYKNLKSKAELNLPQDKKIILLQGAGINIERGAEELIQSMTYIENTLLLIIGGGDVIPELKKMTKELKLENKIRFIPKQPFDQLYNYTMHADLGLSLDKDTNINYRYSLPNKLFDYIQAGVPVLISPLVELRKIVEKYNIGTWIDKHSPQHIADKVNTILRDETILKQWKKNTNIAKTKLNWEKEEQKLLTFIKEYQQ